jgi:hypothetical protein
MTLHPRTACAAPQTCHDEAPRSDPRRIPVKTHLLLLAFLLAGCDEVARTLGTCSDSRSAYDADVAGQGKLLEAPPAQGPYAMALVVSEKAANDLLAAVTDHELPTLSQDLSGLTVSLTPRFPRLQIAELADCPGCILADLEFTVSVGVPGLGAFTGGGTASLGVPLSLEPGAPRQTRLLAGLDRARVRHLDLDVAGLQLSDVPALEGLVEGLAEQLLNQNIGETELTTVESWSIGATELAARGPTVSAREHTLVIGLATNLDLPPTTTLDEQATLPEGTDLSLRFHPGLLLGLSQRLMTEGEIPSSYDASGAASSDGSAHVALEGMAAGDAGALRTTFRVYQLGDALCGSADLAGDLALQITGESVSLQVRSLQVVGGTGAGQFLTEAGWLSGDFLQSLVGNLALTLNYRDLKVGGAPANVAPTSITVDGSGVTVNLDLVDG